MAFPLGPVGPYVGRIAAFVAAQLAPRWGVGGWLMVGGGGAALSRGAQSCSALGQPGSSTGALEALWADGLSSGRWGRGLGVLFGSLASIFGTFFVSRGGRVAFSRIKSYVGLHFP